MHGAMLHNYQAASVMQYLEGSTRRIKAGLLSGTRCNRGLFAFYFENDQITLILFRQFDSADAERKCYGCLMVMCHLNVFAYAGRVCPGSSSTWQ